MKRTIAVLLALCVLLALAACAKTETPASSSGALAASIKDRTGQLTGTDAPPEPTPEPEETPPGNYLDESAPIPADNYKGELTETVFEDANLLLRLPAGVSAYEEPITENFAHVYVKDDEGKWTLRFEPFIRGENTVNNISSSMNYNGNWIKEDWSQDVAGTLAGFPIRVWANNIREGWLYPDNEQDTPAVDIVMDYGETLVGRWYGMYIRLEAQEPTEDTNIYELLYLRAVRAVLNNFEAVVTGDGVTYSAGGITATFPARWEVLEGVSGFVTSFHGAELSGGVNIDSAYGGDYAGKAALWEGEAITQTYGGVEYPGVIIAGAGETPTYTVRLYGPFSEGRSLSVYVNLRGSAPEDYKAFLDGELFTGIMESIEIDPDGYHEPGTAAADGFTTDRGAIDSYTGPGGDIEIPALVGEYDTTSIYADAFAGNDDIISVLIPEGVTTIGPGAFEGCANLETVVFPNTLTEIYQNAFRDCPKLRDVVLPDGVSFVGGWAFEGSGAGSFTGPGAVYDQKCFEDSTFDVITIGAGADISGEYMFSGSAAAEINLPEDLEVLGRSAFSGCKNLQALVLPDTLRQLGENCFSNMRGGYSVVLPEGITEIPAGCFNSTDLDVLTIPASVTKIGDNATFSGAYILLLNPEAELGQRCLNADYIYIEDAARFVFPDYPVMWTRRVYLDGVYDTADIQGDFAVQTVTSQLYLPMDATFQETGAVDDWLMSMGCDDIAWVGSARAFLPENTLDFQTDGAIITGYTGGAVLNIPQFVMHYDEPFWSSDNVYGIADGAFAGAGVTSVYFPGTMGDGFGSRILADNEALADIWFNTVSAEELGRDDYYAADTFEGVPAGVTVHLPASLTAEERARTEEAILSRGLPDTAAFDYYALRDGAADAPAAEPAEAPPADDGAVEGVYTGLYTKVVGDPDDVRNEEEEFSLTLNADGTGVHHRDGMEFNVAWTLEGEQFSMTEIFIGDPIEYTGVLSGGRLDIFNGDPEDIWTYEYVYQK